MQNNQQNAALELIQLKATAFDLTNQINAQGALIQRIVDAAGFTNGDAESLVQHIAHMHNTLLKNEAPIDAGNPIERHQDAVNETTDRGVSRKSSSRRARRFSDKNNQQG